MTGLRITRPRGWSDRIRAYRILVDGAEVGRIKESQTLDVELAPGDHRLEARIDWCAAKPLDISLAADEVVDIEVRNTHGPALGILAISIWRGRYLTLERKMASPSAL